MTQRLQDFLKNWDFCAEKGISARLLNIESRLEGLFRQLGVNPWLA